MTTNLSELKGRPVLDLSSATTVGRVGTAVVDPGAGSVVALRIQGASGGDVLPWTGIEASA